MVTHEEIKLVESVRDLSLTLYRPNHHHSQCGQLLDTLVRQRGAVKLAVGRLPDTLSEPDRAKLQEAVNVLKGKVQHYEGRLEANQAKLADIKLHVENRMVLLREVKADHTAGNFLLAPLLILRMFQVERAVGTQRKLETRIHRFVSRVTGIKDRLFVMHAELNLRRAVASADYCLDMAETTINRLQKLAPWLPIPNDLAHAYDKGLIELYHRYKDLFDEGHEGTVYKKTSEGN